MVFRWCFGGILVKRGVLQKGNRGVAKPKWYHNEHQNDTKTSLKCTKMNTQNFSFFKFPIFFHSFFFQCIFLNSSYNSLAFCIFLTNLSLFLFCSNALLHTISFSFFICSFFFVCISLSFIYFIVSGDVICWLGIFPLPHQQPYPPGPVGLILTGNWIRSSHDTLLFNSPPSPTFWIKKHKKSKYLHLLCLLQLQKITKDKISWKHSLSPTCIKLKICMQKCDQNVCRSQSVHFTSWCCNQNTKNLWSQSVYFTENLHWSSKHFPSWDMRYALSQQIVCINSNVSITCNTNVKLHPTVNF